MALTFTQVPATLRISNNTIQEVIAVLNKLKNLGVLSAYQSDNAISQINGFRRNYLK